MQVQIISTFGSGYYWYYLIDERVAGIPLLITGMTELIGVGWFYSRPFVDDRLFKNLKDMGCEVKYSRWFWLITWTFVAPFTLAFILVYDLSTTGDLVLAAADNYLFPEWSLSIAWALLALSPGIILIVALLIVCVQFKAYTACIASWKPMDRWVSAEDETDDDAPPPYRVSATEDIELGAVVPFEQSVKYIGSQDTGFGSGDKLKYYPPTAPQQSLVVPPIIMSRRSVGDQSIIHEGEASTTMYLGDF